MAPSFDDLFINSPAKIIDYSENVYPWNTISVPVLNDSVQDVAKTLKALVDIVQRGKSIALHTGNDLPPTLEQIAEAASDITTDRQKLFGLSPCPLGKEQFKAWREGVAMPHFDWETAHENSGKFSSDNGENLEALQTIYQQPKINLSNLNFVLQHKPQMQPLLQAVVLFNLCLRGIVHGNPKYAGMMEPIELRTCDDIIATTKKILEDSVFVGLDLELQVMKYIGVIQERRNAVSSRIHARSRVVMLTGLSSFQPTGPGLFQSTSPGLFGQGTPSLFGQGGTGFGQGTLSLFGQGGARLGQGTTNTRLFGQGCTGFGQTSNTAGLFGHTSNTGLFGQGGTGFRQPSNTGLFGQGGTVLFGQGTTGISQGTRDVKDGDYAITVDKVITHFMEQLSSLRTKDSSEFEATLSRLRSIVAELKDALDTLEVKSEGTKN
ncbi:hypothetical protein QBC38DRAFT_465304 [Podospora fimiseda]|uniref:Uncharacterized protein n=1 Tax=Podospora fimiseda TaxID=252190 RepID=A0AAN7BYE6_9PEZI|nr:hypothetical protein QBC38DRAFT_465304 [Podospora fimiseda]